MRAPSGASGAKAPCGLWSQLCIRDSASESLVHCLKQHAFHTASSLLHQVPPPDTQYKKPISHWSKILTAPSQVQHETTTFSAISDRAWAILKFFCHNSHKSGFLLTLHSFVHLYLEARNVGNEIYSEDNLIIVFMNLNEHTSWPKWLWSSIPCPIRSPVCHQKKPNKAPKIATIGHKELWSQMLLRSLCDLFFLFRWTLYLRKPPPPPLPTVREKDKIKRTERSRASGYEITVMYYFYSRFLISNCFPHRCTNLLSFRHAFTRTSNVYP